MRKILSNKAGLITALFFVLFGFLLILGKIYLKQRSALERPPMPLQESTRRPDASVQQPFSSYADWEKIAFDLLEICGIALLTSGIFTVVLQIPDWRKYFEQRLRNIVLDQSYLDSLDQNSLVGLQVKTLKAFFKTHDIDREGSFLNYFQTNLSNYIKTPYRDGVKTEMVITEVGDQCFKISDRITYTCRMVGGQIQENIKWRPEKDEFKDIFSLRFMIRRRESHTSEEVVTLTKSGDNYVCKKGPNQETLQLADILGQGILFPLKDFNEDGLFIDIRSEYLVIKGRFLTWQMAHPTNGFYITIKYPEAWVINFQPLVLHPEEVVSNSIPGFYSMQYPKWMLPWSGVVYSFTKADVCCPTAR